MDEIKDIFQASAEKYGKPNINQGEFRRIILSDYPYYYTYTEKGKKMILNKFIERADVMYKFMESKSHK